MGKDGERTMMDLILDCGIFLPVRSGHGSYYQLSGKSICIQWYMQYTKPHVKMLQAILCPISSFFQIPLREIKFCRSQNQKSIPLKRNISHQTQLIHPAQSVSSEIACYTRGQLLMHEEVFDLVFSISVSYVSLAPMYSKLTL